METLEPKLRFPEFDDDWNNFTLEQLTDKVGDGLHGTPEYVDNSDVYFINGNNLIDGKIVISETSKKVSLETFTKNDKGLNYNSILISINGTIGSISRYNNEKIMLGKSVGYFNFKQSKDFYFHILQSNKVQDYFVSELTGSTIKNLSLKTLRETNIYQPLLEEQTKIANFLSSIDERIDLLKEKKSLLEDYKKGLMQKIFNQEIRFKNNNGNDYKDWETINLIDILKENKTRNKNNEITEVFSVAKSKGVINQIEHLGRSYASDNITNYKVVFENDIIYTKSPTSDFPYGIIKQNKLNRKGVVSVLYGIFTPINKYVGNLLENYFSDWKNTYNYLDPIIQKGAKNTINIGNETFLNGESLLFPMDINEQIKISNFLITMDSKIEIVSNQIQDTQEYKKGLLQQMFI